MFATLRRFSVRIGRWPRWCAAALCLLLAAADAVSARAAQRTPPVPSVAVVVAARALPVGHVLARRDLALIHAPPRYAPVGASASITHTVGQRLAGPLAADEAVTASRLVGKSLTSGLGPDLVVSSVLLDGDVRQWVHAGDRVDLLATPRPDVIAADGVAPTGTQRAAAALTLAHRILVLAVYAAPSDLATGASTQLVIASSRADATRITALRLTDVFTALGDPP